MDNVEPKSGLKKGCLTFILVLAALAAGAGASVLLKGKSMKPKSRALVIGKLEARVEEIKGMLSADMDQALREEFIEAFRKYSVTQEKHGSAQFEHLGELRKSLALITADGIITSQEAAQWAGKVAGFVETGKNDIDD